MCNVLEILILYLSILILYLSIASLTILKISPEAKYGPGRLGVEIDNYGELQNINKNKQ